MVFRGVFAPPRLTIIRAPQSFGHDEKTGRARKPETDRSPDGKCAAAWGATPPAQRGLLRNLGQEMRAVKRRRPVFAGRRLMVPKVVIRPLPMGFMRFRLLSGGGVRSQSEIRSRRSEVR